MPYVPLSLIVHVCLWCLRVILEFNINQEDALMKNGRIMYFEYQVGHQLQISNIFQIAFIKA